VDWWATATDFTEKFANKQVATFMSALGTDVIDIFDRFEQTALEKQSLPTGKEKFTNYFTPTPQQLEQHSSVSYLITSINIKTRKR
jgi:hypothetical protein